MLLSFVDGHPPRAGVEPFPILRPIAQVGWDDWDPTRFGAYRSSAAGALLMIDAVYSPTRASGPYFSTASSSGDTSL